MSLKKISNNITVVMYHYVRDVKSTNFPNIKGISVSEFSRQIAFFKKNYCFVTLEECILALQGEFSLPKNPILLTFDDGFADHYENVYPILLENNISGVFFPPAESVLESRVLLVNKIQFILSKVQNVGQIELEIFNTIDEMKDRHGLESKESYLSKYLKPRSYDDKHTGFVKNMLQKGLPEKVRKELVNKLFQKYITYDERSFASELYMTPEQLKNMIDHGMSVGSHCYNHIWLNTLDRSKQERQIDLSLQFLSDIGVSTRNWAMCYPHGGYDGITIDLLKKKNCALAFTVNSGLWNIGSDDKYEIPRQDTNKFLQQ